MWGQELEEGGGFYLLLIPIWFFSELSSSKGLCTCCLLCSEVATLYLWMFIFSALSSLRHLDLSSNLPLEIYFFCFPTPPIKLFSHLLLFTFLVARIPVWNGTALLLLMYHLSFLFSLPPHSLQTTEGQGPGLACPPMFSWCLEQWLTHYKILMNICYMNKWTLGSMSDEVLYIKPHIWKTFNKYSFNECINSSELSIRHLPFKTLNLAKKRFWINTYLFDTLVSY